MMIIIRNFKWSIRSHLY